MLDVHGLQGHAQLSHSSSTSTLQVYRIHSHEVLGLIPNITHVQAVVVLSRLRKDVTKLTHYLILREMHIALKRLDF